MSLPLGRVLNERYRIERELGEGGMAVVYLATDLQQHRSVALKVLRPELAGLIGPERFLREIELAGKLSHPHIAPLFDAGEADGLPYYVMPFIEGETLREKLTRERQLSIDDALLITREVAGALAYAHALGIVHRDVKPGNIMLSRGHALLVDFGIARALTVAGVREKLTGTGMSIGTVEYMSPEQASGSGDVDDRSDQYSLACVLYEMLAGAPPFVGPSAQSVLAKQLADPVPSIRTMRNTVPAPMEAAILSALAKAKADRFPNVGAFVEALEGKRPSPWQPSPGSMAAGPSREPASTLRRKRIVIAVAVLAAVGVAGLRFWPPTDHTTRPTASLLDPKRVVIATFENRTGDASLDAVGEMAADWIARGLTGAEILEVSGTSGDIAARMGEKVPAGSQDLDSLAHLARAGLVVSGAYYRRGDSLLIQADITDAARRNRVQSIGPIATLTRSPDAGVEEIRVRVTGALGTLVDSTLAGVASQLTKPPSVEAYREYLAGEHLFYGHGKAAGDRLVSAYKLDTTFTFALIRAAGAYWDGGEVDSRDSLLRILKTKRDRLSAFERAYMDYVDASRAGSAQKDAARAMVAAAPRSAWAQLLLALQLQYNPPAQPRAALRLLDRLDPESGGMRGRTVYFRDLGNVLHDLGDTARAVREAERGRRIYGPLLIALTGQMFAYASAGKLKAVDSMVPDVLTASPENGVRPVDVILEAAVELRAHGHADAAKRLDARLLTLVERLESAPLQTSRDAFGLARYYTELERWRDVARIADTLKARAKKYFDTADYDRADAIGVSGVALARMGRSAEALLKAEALDSLLRTTSDSEKRQGYGEPDYWRAAIAIALGDKATAVELLARSFENRACGRLCHTDPFLIDLFDYLPFQELVRPKQ